MLLNAPINDIPAKPIYLIYGEDIWQANDAIKRITKYYTGLNGDANNIKKYYFTNFLQFVQFKTNNSSELFNLDLFCAKDINKLIKINIGNGKFNKQQQVDLINLITTLADGSQHNFVIILIAEKLEQATLNTAWFKEINKIGVVIRTKPLSSSAMRTWVIKQFKQANLKLTEEALNMFVIMYQNNLNAAAQSIYKLKLIFSNKVKDNIQEINLGTLSQFVADESQFSLFDLQNALEVQDLAKTVYLLNKLKEEGQEAILVLWVIIRAIKAILVKVNNQLVKKQLYCLLQKAGEVDLAIKGCNTISVPNPGNNNEYIWSLITDLCLSFQEEKV